MTLSRYRVTFKDGTTIEVDADKAVLASDSGEAIDLDAAAYDAVDIEAAGLVLRDNGRGLDG